MIVSKKKQKATTCSDHRTVRLVSHTAKIVETILRRIERKVEDKLGEEQFRFRRGVGTREALGC